MSTSFAHLLSPAGFDRRLPNPNPNPGVPLDVSTCPGTGTGQGDDSSCSATFQCRTGDFYVYCYTDFETGLSNCTCRSPSGNQTTAPVMSGGKACFDAARYLCN